jgi:3D (Asp-Asp-Asp) domain-containing protein
MEKKTIDLHKKIKRLKAWKDFKDILLLLILLNFLINNLKQINLEIFYEATPAVMVYKANATLPEKVEREISDQPQDSLVAEFSAYTARVEETDNDPITMASGRSVYDGAIANNCLPFGTRIEVNGKVKVVEDRMNSRYDCNHFDIFFSDYDEAIQFGRKELSYKII